MLALRQATRQARVSLETAPIFSLGAETLSTKGRRDQRQQFGKRALATGKPKPSCKRDWRC